MTMYHIFSRRIRGLQARKSAALLAALALVGTAFLPTRSLAQSNIDGAVAGRVSDAQGSVLVEGTATGLKRSVKPAADGSYRVGSLPPGPYTVTFTPTGGSPITEDVIVTVGGTTAVNLDSETVRLEKFVVSGSSINPIDFGKTTSSVVLSKENIDTLPIARSTTAIALLTPGTVQADSQFNLIGVGRIASFSGASVAENAYYVNGFNLTNFRNGLGGSNVPFDFYDQFEVINGAYSAQYGRSTGGVINGTTRRGTNDYRAEANVIYRPSGWRNPSVYFTDLDTGRREILDYRGLDTVQRKETNLIFSGPLIKDKLFIAGLVNRTEVETESVVNSGTQFNRSQINNPFYALKVDAEPFSGQHFEYTFFSDQETTDRESFMFVAPTKTIAPTPLTTPKFDRGGKNHIFGYTGVFFEDLTLSAVYGEGDFDRTNSSPQDSLAYVQDARGPLSTSPRALQGVSSVINALDSRKALRVDLEYAFQLAGYHRLRVGYDSESNTSFDETQYGGGERWRFVSTTPGRTVLGAVVPAGISELVYKRVYKTGGSFQVDSDALFIEDNWSLLNDRLLLRIGFRDEKFENFNAAGDTFIKVEDQRSPRLGASYDLFGDKKTKVFANFGRYYLPVASNTNLRLAGGEFDEQTYFLPGDGGVDANGIPNRGAQFATSLVSDGSVADTTSLVDKNLTPMYQDEYVIGVQREINRQWNVSVRGIYRNLGSSFDDAIVDQALNVYAAKNGLPDQTDSFHYVLINPGKDATINWDFGDGVSREVLMAAEDLGFPNATRKYYSAEVALERVWDGKWSARMSYVWSHNYGNTEGLVLSDNGQDDAGITLLFDTPDLTMNTYGNLPNDRRHVFKAWGAYALTRELTVGLNTSLSSGKPINRIGALPDGDSIADFYGAAYLLQPRGSAGTTPWIFAADLSLIYSPAWAQLGRVKTNFQMDVFNVLGRKGYTAVDEYATNDELATNYSYLSPTDFQTPRYVQFRVGLSY